MRFPVVVLLVLVLVGGPTAASTEDERALDAYQRMIVDDPASAESAEARVGLARLLLRERRYGEAARWLEEAIDGGVSETTFARPLRELAVRRLLESRGAPALAPSERIETGIRSPAGFAPTSTGGLLIGDRKRERVIELDRHAAVIGDWTVPDLQTLAVGPRGDRFAAADERVYRLERGGPMPLASLGSYGPVSQLVVDALGGFWLLDRRGKKIARIDPGQSAPRPYWRSEEASLTALAWDGQRLIGLDGRKRVVAIGADGVATTLLADESMRSAGLACEPGGRIAVLDTRNAVVRFLYAEGAAATPPSLAIAIERPVVAIGLGLDGVLHLLDGADGSWVRRP